MTPKCYDLPFEQSQFSMEFGVMADEVILVKCDKWGYSPQLARFEGDGLETFKSGKSKIHELATGGSHALASATNLVSIGKHDWDQCREAILRHDESVKNVLLYGDEYKIPKNHKLSQTPESSLS